ncbi:glycosyltransferase family protein [Candidatus Nitronereus thalassa]|uniref:Glycosyltransferase family protein n=1 Tax=Candidatus Nitronereus thalassa TaxID=3020898 RepID=A0ABU3K637_9BACT|nr:glycosyltransferase family protein [Candidatus Nitronereus thalassa]MDT7041853.1 glycosyltransferase family protein [Candidatus Nitronereus thalassa]
MDTASQRPVAIVQARMGSTRLPGKVMRLLIGKPVLWHVVDRLRFCKQLGSIVVATTTAPEDDAIEEWCFAHWVRCFRGSENDVLDRYYQAASFYQASSVLRITADCPAIDPEVVDELIEEFEKHTYDICGLSGSFPDGLDCEVMDFCSLERAWKEAELASEREHVTPYLHAHPELFRAGKFERFFNLAHHRWTLDEEADLRFLERVFHRLYQEDRPFVASDVLALLEREPELMSINQGIVRNEGYLRSLEADHRVGARN